MRGLATALACLLMACAAEDRPTEPDSPEAAAEQDEADATGHLLVQMRWDGARMEVVRVTPVARPLPTLRGGLVGRAWRFRSIAPDGSRLHEGELDDPTHLHGDGVHLRRTGPVDFVIRVPATATDWLEFAEVPRTARASARSAAAAPFARLHFPAQVP